MYVYYSDNDSLSRFYDLGTVSSGGQIAQAARTWNNLKPGARYTVRLLAQVGQVVDGAPFIERCFQMPEEYVDWDGISGQTGSSSCPGGATQTRASLISIQSGAKSVTASNTALNFADLRTWTGKPLSTSFSVGLWLYGPDGVFIRGEGLGTATSFRNIAQQTKTFSNLKPGTRYTMRIFAASGGNNQVAVACFQTRPDLSRTLGWHDDVRRFASGCFAQDFTRAQVRACLCGARHTDGRWAPTDDEDGFEWQISAPERTQQRCGN